MSLRKFFESFEYIPTTKFRVLVTLGLITATCVTYLIHACDIRDQTTGLCVGWEPSINWLVFLSALSGVDVTQYFAKSVTGVKHAQVTATARQQSTTSQEDEDVTSTTDVSEYNRDENLKG